MTDWKKTLPGDLVVASREGGCKFILDLNDYTLIGYDQIDIHFNDVGIVVAVTVNPGVGWHNYNAGFFLYPRVMGWRYLHGNDVIEHG